MSVKNVEKENGSATLILEVEKERFDAATDQAYRQNRKNILVPGFRKGKAPRKAIEGMYGASVFYDDAINILFPEVYDQAIKEAELKVVGMPSVTDMDLKDGVLTLTVKTDLYPEVTLGEYKGLEAPKTEPKVTAAEVDEDLKATRGFRRSTARRRMATRWFWIMRALTMVSHLKAARQRATA